MPVGYLLSVVDFIINKYNDDVRKKFDVTFVGLEYLSLYLRHIKKVLYHARNPIEQ